MTPAPPEWRPGRKEQRLDWWLKRIVRYGVGVPGCIYFTLVEHNELNALLFVVVGGSWDVGQFVVVGIRAALKEMRDVEKLMREQDGSRDSHPPES